MAMPLWSRVFFWSLPWLPSYSKWHRRDCRCQGTRCIHGKHAGTTLVNDGFTCWPSVARSRDVAFSHCAYYTLFRATQYRNADPSTGPSSIQFVELGWSTNDRPSSMHVHLLKIYDRTSSPRRTLILEMHSVCCDDSHPLKAIHGKKVTA